MRTFIMATLLLTTQAQAEKSVRLPPEERGFRVLWAEENGEPMDGILEFDVVDIQPRSRWQAGETVTLTLIDNGDEDDGESVTIRLGHKVDSILELYEFDIIGDERHEGGVRPDGNVSPGLLHVVKGKETVGYRFYFRKEQGPPGTLLRPVRPILGQRGVTVIWLITTRTYARSVESLATPSQ